MVSSWEKNKFSKLCNILNPRYKTWKWLAKGVHVFLFLRVSSCWTLLKCPREPRKAGVYIQKNSTVWIEDLCASVYYASFAVHIGGRWEVVQYLPKFHLNKSSPLPPESFIFPYREGKQAHTRGIQRHHDDGERSLNGIKKQAKNKDRELNATVEYSSIMERFRCKVFDGIQTWMSEEPNVTRS